MFSKKKDPVAIERNTNKTTGTIIGEGLVIEAGNIKGSGNVRIDGKFSGNISLDGHIIIGETGFVEGEIKARSALFAGTFNGNMFIEDTVHLAPDSNVTGQVESGKMIMDEDAVFNGHCTMSKGGIGNNVKEIVYNNDRSEPEEDVV